MSEIKFDAGAAERMISEMNIYCTGVQKETRDILSILKSEDTWDDRQTKAFQANMSEIAKDLNQALRHEGDYMRTYYSRVQELRGQI